MFRVVIPFCYYWTVIPFWYYSSKACFQKWYNFGTRHRNTKTRQCARKATWSEVIVVAKSNNMLVLVWDHIVLDSNTILHACSARSCMHASRAICMHVCSSLGLMHAGRPRAIHASAACMDARHANSECMQSKDSRCMRACSYRKIKHHRETFLKEMPSKNSPKPP